MGLKYSGPAAVPVLGCLLGGSLESLEDAEDDRGKAVSSSLADSVPDARKEYASSAEYILWDIVYLYFFVYL